MRRIVWRERAEEARCPAPPLIAKRQQDQLNRRVGFPNLARACNHAYAFFRDDRQELAHLPPCAVGEQMEEGLAFDLTTKQRAHPGPRKTKRMARARLERQNESVRKRATDGARLDFCALRHHPSAAPLLPVIE